MQLRDYLDPTAISLSLTAASKEGAMAEMVSLLGFDEPSSTQLVLLIARREQLGSTGIGRGIAVPHCRSLVVNRLRIAFGRHLTGIDYGSIDQRPVSNLFLLVAPPHEISNQYVPVLARIAQFAREPDVPERLRQLAAPEDLFALFAEKGV
jgi:mannitol/fructose-specific phosphotransferase system IIA component (Ntr-type)